MTDQRHVPRHQIEVKLPCGGCLHQGVCLIEEQLEQDLTLRIGVKDAASRLVDGGVRQSISLRIDCSWFDPRPKRGRQLTSEERDRRVEQMRANQRRQQPRADSAA